jgi:hypothetical protein
MTTIGKVSGATLPAVFVRVTTSLPFFTMCIPLSIRPDMYQRLVRYKEEQGHCLVPRKYVKDPKLSTWVETQRMLWNRDYRNVAPIVAVKTAAVKTVARSGSLSGYDYWTSNSDCPSYDCGLNTTTQTAECATLPLEPHPFRIENDTPSDTTLTPNQVAAAMVSINNGKRLTIEQKRKLDGLGFVWSLRAKKIEDQWDEMFKQLVMYKEEYGDCLVPCRFERNMKLGKWVSCSAVTSVWLTLTIEAKRISFRQISPFSHYRSRRYVLAYFQGSDDRTCLFTPFFPLGLQQRYEYTILQRSSRLNESATAGTAFKNLVGVPLSTIDVHSHTMKKGSHRANPRLTEDRIRLLESIGFHWKIKHKMKRHYDKHWESMFDRLKAFKDSNGHCFVPKRYPADLKLGTWVSLKFSFSVLLRQCH